MIAEKPEIAFIGFGLMEAGFTKRLISLGYEVAGHDADPTKVVAAGEWGVEPASSAAEAARESDIVQICILETSSVSDIVLGKGGIAGTGQAGAVVVDHGTTVLDATREMAEKLEHRCGMAWVDAPVSGGPSAAEDGSFAIMAGGSDDAIAKIYNLMDDLSGVFTHMGNMGAGQITKW
jgi:3-hydroxyisobutyrate dehydrogenase-like beta-hydroxyacid dehydrogenase